MNLYKIASNFYNLCANNFFALYLRSCCFPNYKVYILIKIQMMLKIVKKFLSSSTSREEEKRKIYIYKRYIILWCFLFPASRTSWFCPNHLPGQRKPICGWIHTKFHFTRNFWAQLSRNCYWSCGRSMGLSIASITKPIFNCWLWQLAAFMGYINASSCLE